MKLRESLPSLAVTLLGVGLAWLGITVGWWILPVPVLLGIVVGWSAFRHGERLLPNAPDEAVRWMGWSILIPGVLGAADQALLIALGILLEISEPASLEIRQLQMATLTAVSTFLIVTFVRAADEADEGWVGKRVQGAFQRAMERYWRFPAGSDGEKAVHSEGWKGLNGWGRDTRRGRAREVAKVLARGGPSRPDQDGWGGGRSGGEGSEAGRRSMRAASVPQNVYERMRTDQSRATRVMALTSSFASFCR